MYTDNLKDGGCSVYKRARIQLRCVAIYVIKIYSIIVRSTRASRPEFEFWELQGTYHCESIFP